MRRKTITLISIIAVIITSLVMLIPKPVYADIDISGYSNDGFSEVKETFIGRFGDLIKAVSLVGTIVSIAALIIIGIKFMVSSVEEKADYKEKAIPYVIGATLVFGISKILDLAISMGEELANSGSAGIETVGGKIITILSLIGSLISVIMLVVIGIRYMGKASVEEQAQYRKAMMPYVVGATLVFAAASIAGMVYNLVQGL